MGTTTLPGTQERIRHYAQLAAQWKPLADKEDTTEDQRRAPLLTRRRNGLVEVKSETGLTDVSLPNGLPARIRILRKMRGFSQRKLAEAIKVHRTAVQLWEKGMRIPTLPYLVRLAEVFGITIGKLCG